MFKKTIITSTSNQTIKDLIKLKKPRERKTQGRFLVEGEREIKIAISSGLVPIQYVLCLEYNKNKENNKINSPLLVSKKVFDKLSNRESPDGNIAVFSYCKKSINELIPTPNPLFIIIESIEKPGNLGAIIRSADAANIDGIILNDSKVDIFNHNVIRSSQGTIFSIPVYFASIKETISFCDRFGISIFSTTPRAKSIYYEMDFTQGSAILLGSEDRGLSDDWLKLNINQIKIPMEGKIDSLNLSVSAAVVLFEVKRQRKYSKHV